MSQLTVNPYQILGQQFSDGLDYIIANIPGSPTIDDLVDVISDYIEGIGYLSSPFTTATTIQVKSVAYTVINSYVNNKCINLYKGPDRKIINNLIGPSFIDNNTVDTISERIIEIEDNIPKCNLSIETQNQLFMATMIGNTCNEYLLEQISEGVGNDWYDNYLSSALTSAIANLPFWVSASMEGSLLGNRSFMKGMLSPTINIVTNEIVSSLIASLIISSGKVIYRWTKNTKLIHEKSFSNTFKSNPVFTDLLDKKEELNRRLLKNGKTDKDLVNIILKGDINSAASFLGYTVEQFEESMRNNIISLRNLYNLDEYSSIGLDQPIGEDPYIGIGDAQTCYGRSGEKCSDHFVCDIYCNYTPLAILCRIAWAAECQWPWLIGH